MRDCLLLHGAQVSSRPERPVFPGDNPQIKSESIPLLRLPTGSLPGQGFNATSRTWPMVTAQPCPRRTAVLNRCVQLAPGVGGGTMISPSKVVG